MDTIGFEELLSGLFQDSFHILPGDRDKALGLLEVRTDLDRNDFGHRSPGQIDGKLSLYLIIVWFFWIVSCPYLKFTPLDCSLYQSVQAYYTRLSKLVMPL